MHPERPIHRPAPASQKPPKKKLIFATIIVAGLCLASAPKPHPIPENPYTLFPVANLPPNPYTFCRRTEGVCAPRIFITQKKDLKEYGAFSKRQLKSIRQLDSRQTLDRLKWLYESTPVEKALRAFPPLALELDLAPSGEAALSSNWGSQPRDTNLALLDFGKNSFQTERELILAHELIHYISWLGSGWEASYFFEGEKISTMSPVWLAEGLTNWAACRTPGFSCVLNPEGTGLKTYHAETYISVFLELLAGKESLRRALIYGDFAEIQSALDKEFGKGTFEQFAEKENASAAADFLALRTDCFRKIPSAANNTRDQFTADALSFLRNTSEILLEAFCNGK